MHCSILSEGTQNQDGNIKTRIQPYLVTITVVTGFSFIFIEVHGGYRGYLVTMTGKLATKYVRSHEADVRKI